MKPGPEEPGDQNQAVDPEGNRDPDKNRHRAPKQPGPERQRPWDDHRPEKWTEAGEGKEEEEFRIDT